MQPQRVTIPVYQVLPAEFFNNTPFIKAILNGKEVNFLFDSGAQEMLLNSCYMEAEAVPSGGGASGVTGQVTTFYAPLGSVSFGELRYEGGELLAIDMQHLEDDFGTVIHGIFGFRQLIHFDWMVDYQAGEIHLWARVPRKELKIRERIKVTYRHHLPMLEVMINGHSFNMLLDTGAPEIYFDQGKRHLIEDLLSDLQPRSMTSSSPEQANVETGYLSHFKVGNLEFGRSVIWIADASGFMTHFDGIDGVIGYAILSQYKVVVNWSNWVLWVLEE